MENQLQRSLTGDYFFAMVVKLEVDHISKSYVSVSGGKSSGLKVLDDVTFTVNEGEIVSLIGPTGCGKTTLLRIIDGIIRPDSGRVLINGSEVVDTRNPACAVVFQNFNLLPWRTALKNVEFGLEAKKVPPAERESTARQYLELVGLTKFERHHPHELSGGMQQRVGLARALAINPEIVLLDEPFSSVDLLLRESLQAEVLKILQTTRKTAVFVTHSINEAMFLSDRIISMGRNPGRVKEILTVDLPRPRTDEVMRTPEAEKILSVIRKDLLEELAV
jgi:ABC-type nitrate/sulfonate/bicarbonate transport system ATPase subunit